MIPITERELSELKPDVQLIGREYLEYYYPETVDRLRDTIREIRAAAMALSNSPESRRFLDALDIQPEEQRP